MGQKRKASEQNSAQKKKKISSARAGAATTTPSRRTEISKEAESPRTTRMDLLGTTSDRQRPVRVLKRLKYLQIRGLWCSRRMKVGIST